MRSHAIVAAAASGVLLWVAAASAQPAMSQPAQLESLSREELIQRVMELQAGGRQTQMQFEAIARRLDALSVQLATSAEERNRLGQELARMRAQLTERAGGDAAVQRLQTQLQAALDRTATLQKQVGELATQNEQLKRSAAEANQKLAELSAQREFLLLQVKTLREQLTVMQNRQGGDEPAIVPASQPEQSTGRAVITARIAQVSGKAVTINLGQQDGVTAGMIFNVFRGGRNIGHFQIREVGKTVSMGVMLDGVRPLEVGDLAIQAEQK
jgi:cell shape-determining protein MreC